MYIHTNLHSQRIVNQHSHHYNCINTEKFETLLPLECSLLSYPLTCPITVITTGQLMHANRPPTHGAYVTYYIVVHAHSYSYSTNPTSLPKWTPPWYNLTTWYCITYSSPYKQSMRKFDRYLLMLWNISYIYVINTWNKPFAPHQIHRTRNLTILCTSLNTP